MKTVHLFAGNDKALDPTKAICGATISRSIGDSFTANAKDVTCPECLKAMREEKHGQAGSSADVPARNA